MNVVRVLSLYGIPQRNPTRHFEQLGKITTKLFGGGAYPVRDMFYTFNQNNSGGHFVASEDIRHYVIVEAGNAAEANIRAEGLGLYFDGYGDCPCCGDRWYEQWSDDNGTVTPQVYGSDDFEFVDSVKKADVVVHYLDGSRKYGVHKSQWSSLFLASAEEE